MKRDLLGEAGDHSWQKSHQGMVLGPTGPSWIPEAGFLAVQPALACPPAAQVITITLEFETYCDKDSLIGQTLLRLP